MITVVVLVAIAVLLILVVVSGYNRLVALDQEANQAFADIDVQLKQRHDLTPNLVETVKGYAAHELATLEGVVAARNAALQARSIEEKVQAENALTGALGRLFALSEAYPDLKADQTFLGLQSALADLENKLAAARRFFNNAVGEFNTVRRAFPNVLFAGLFGYGRDRTFFDVGAEARASMNEAPPRVSFGT